MISAFVYMNDDFAPLDHFNDVIKLIDTDHFRDHTKMAVMPVKLCKDSEKSRFS